jgi:HNH endonuclease
MTTRMQWRACVGFPDYEVSECGDVRRVSAGRTRSEGWRLRGYVNADGYLAYTLQEVGGTDRAVTAHILVATAFIGPRPSPQHEVAHDNGSRVECHYTNLRWDTRAGNHADMREHGTSVVGERNGRAKITERDVLDIRREYRRIKDSRGRRSVAELDARYGLHRATICNIARGRTWQHVPMPTAEA